MSIQRAKPLEILYDEVEDYDLVVVPDAPLADGLNRHLDRPHLGDFATIPRRLAAGGREEHEERTVFLELLSETDLSWKQAAYLGEEIIHCWEYTGRPDAILDYDQFDTPAVRRAVEHVKHLETTSRALTDYTIDDDLEVAVVGYPQLSELERSILPAEFNTVGRFADDAFEYPPFHLFDTSADIIATLLDTITVENADDVGVVLDAGSEFSTLLESALDAAEIPFYGGPGFLDQPDHRTFLRLLRTAFRGGDVRVGDVKPVLQRLDFDVGTTHDEKRLHQLDIADLDEFVEWCTTIRDGEWTFKRALTEFGALLDDGEFSAFQEELVTLGLASQSVTESRVDDLEFYLQSYDVPLDREHEGVLLADAKSATTVDRPLVFYLGLDDDWTQTPPQRPWVDRQAEFERHLQRFQALLQNGEAQYYLARDTVGGEPVTPCLYFEELLEESFTQFSDLEAARYTAPQTSTDAGFDASPLSVEPEQPATISQSSLSTYVNSPRDYFFDRLVDSPDRDFFRKGNLFHDFAEFYVHHPDVVANEDLDTFADVMLEEMSPFVRDVDRAVHRTHYEAGLQNVIAYLDEHAPAASDLVLDGPDVDENTFAAYFDRPVGATVTEQWFESVDLGVKGKIDLVASPGRLVDYKSGSKKSARQVVKNSAIEDLSDTPDFQALLYLAYQRTQQPGEQLEFVFVHFLENLDDIVRGEGDLADTLTSVTYYPTPYVEFVRQQSTFERLRDDGANDCQKTFSKAEYADFAAVFDDADFPATRDRDELIESPFGDALVDRMVEAVGDYKYVRNGCKQALRELMRIRNGNYFEDDLDAFEAFVDERLTELHERRAGDERFPVTDLLEEPNYRRVDHRDLLLEDSR
ncbi:PD-(D/E)XK nuclease family protein [Halobacterium sp. KA-6]|uniref:PD-(D/E)XK nuclease family protein n=1 Tax=Halobacterium sp. KA-6 TaxID=2896368 RepID=UPI001E5384D1|nr:PD-(D/E)XK nuclease family protein [Halobacterium sp. KA-6]MCD2203317.1 PD-(D/E)XK nuclease family protein [Halobacterium sp. KA-6]